LGSGQPGAAEAWWLELGSARNALVQARQQWCSGLQKILGRWRMLERHNAPHAFDELQGLLDMNGYFSRAQAWQEPKRV
jgi:hypothetical protein